jgi:hypothetical protein
MSDPAPGRYEFLDFNAPSSSRRADAIAKALAGAEPSMVLDIGCGWSELLLRVLAAAPDATGTGIDTDRSCSSVDAPTPPTAGSTRGSRSSRRRRRPSTRRPTSSSASALTTRTVPSRTRSQPCSSSCGRAAGSSSAAASGSGRRRRLRARLALRSRGTRRSRRRRGLSAALHPDGQPRRVGAFRVGLPLRRGGLAAPPRARARRC